MFKLQITAVSVLFAAACGGGGGAESDTEATGEARYADAETRPDGSDNEPASPQSEFSVSVEVSGSGELSGLDPSCLDGATGQFEGLLSGAAEIDDGIYFAAVAAGEASFTTPGGCDIPDLEIAALSEVVIRGELTATTATCESYCAAKARQFAEGECSGEADQASCRAAAEGDYSVTCEVSCESTENRVVAETALSTAARTELVASQVTGSALGTISADLTFDRIEDSDGNVVDEQ